jgi:hypothetical protein
VETVSDPLGAISSLVGIVGGLQGLGVPIKF